MEGNRFIGIDLGKRTYQASAISSRNCKERWNGSTDESGQIKMLGRLREGDGIAMEAGMTAFIIYRRIIDDVKKVRVVVLNPGKLGVIYASMNKKDKEDAFKLAWIVQAFPETHLPTVPLPSIREEEMRRVSSAQVFLKQERTR